MLARESPRLDEHPDRDPLSAYVAAFGAILATGLTPAGAAEYVK